MVSIERFRLSSIVFGWLLALAAPVAGRASLVVSYAESPGQQTTSVNNASTMTFDNVTLGWNNNLAFNPGGTTLGSYDSIRVVPTDQYGGAYNTRYVTVSNSVATLTLSSRISYFGMWWSAGDPQNILDFYDGNTLVARFTTENLLNALPDEYRGNPTPAYYDQNHSERYAYLNFFGWEGTKWDRIQIRNSGSSGFESDNHSVREAEWDIATEGALPGVVFERIDGVTSETISQSQLTETPEPGSLALVSTGALLVVFGTRGRRARLAAVAARNAQR